MAGKRFGLLRALVVAAAVTFAMGPLRSARAQDVTNLQRVGIELAKFNKPGALYAYIRDYHPQLFEVANRLGLAEALDGKVTTAKFIDRIDAALPGVPEADRATVAQQATTLKGILRVLDGERTRSKRQGLTAEEIKKGGNVTAELRKNLYEADKHWISETWGADKRGSVGVRFVPGKLAWFNPNVSIPELGIRAGVPLTDAQKEAVAALFSFETVPDKPGTAEGTAAFPAHVGRAINPNSHVLTVINERGEVISDLVVKGGGPNKPNATRDGRLETSEALMDSEVARNLYRSGVKNYDALCVIVPDGLDGKALLVRAPRTMMRHIDMDKLDDKELKETLDRFTREIAVREGLKNGLSIAEWAKTYLPRVSGENWGILSGLGIEHGSVYTRDNHGLGETVDWGWVALHEGGKTDQKSYEWDNVKDTIERVNKILADGEKIVIDEAKKIFDAAFEAGKARGLKEKVRLDPKVLEKLSDSDLRTLASKVTDPTGKATTSIDKLRASGHVMETLPFTTLARLPLATLREVASHNGLRVAANADRATVIAALEGRSVAEVNRDLVRNRTLPGDKDKVETDGMSERLRDIVKSRTMDKDKVRIR